jgi:hypothetical protein
MNYDWITHPLGTYIAIATGLILCLYLFLSVMREVRALGVRAGARAENLERTLAKMQAHVAEWEILIKESQPSLGPLPAEGLNLTRRAKALRMYRRGESASSIAAALGSPANEMHLLIKVQRLLAQGRNGQAA